MSMVEKFSPKKEQQNNKKSSYARFNQVDDLTLHEFASENEVKKLEGQMIFVEANKIDINFQDEEFGWRTPLHIACERGYFLFVYVLMISFDV